MIVKKPFSGFCLMIVSTISVAASPLNGVAALQNLPAVCAQSTNCQLTDDIKANKHYKPESQFHHSGNHETNYYLASQVSVDPKDNNLVLSTISLPNGTFYNCAESYEGKRLCQYLSGWIDTKGLWSTQGVTHGYVEVRATMPAATDGRNWLYEGMWPAVWMLPVSEGRGWPTRGEIDILEMHGKDPNTALTTLHYGNVVEVTDYLDKTFIPNPAYYVSPDSFGKYHTIGLEWNFSADNPYLATWYDGIQVAKRSLNAIYKGQPIFGQIFKPAQDTGGYYLVLNIATGGNFGPVTSRTSNGSGDNDNPLLQMRIDSIKSYKLD